MSQTDKTNLMRAVRKDYVALLRLLNSLFDEIQEPLTDVEILELTDILKSLTLDMDRLGRWIRKYKKEERPDEL